MKYFAIVKVRSINYADIVIVAMDMSMKKTFVIYAVLAAGMLGWQAMQVDLLAMCRFNADACGSHLRSATVNAIFWPVYLIGRVS